jgi:5-methylcytosine-specific restriction endonuclease McrA
MPSPDRVTRLAAGKRYRAANRETINVGVRAWRKTLAGKAYKARHQARRRYQEASGTFTVVDITDLYATQGGRCYYCSVEIENGYHIEHMTPLCRGGRNDVSNVCLACAPCNLKKNRKTAEEFRGEQKQ